MKRIFSLFALALLTLSVGAANTYVKVTNLDQMEEGKKYILVNEEASVALGELNTSGSNNYGTTVNITMDNGVIDIDGTVVVELTTVGRSQDEFGNPTFNFRMGEDSRYFAWISGNSLTSINAPGSTNSQWLPTLTSDGVILKNREDNARILQYNASAPRFAAYTSTQKPAVLYIQSVPEEEGITLLSEANALEDNAEFTFNGDAVVTAFTTYQGISYLFLRDESGYGMVAGVEGTFANGQVLSQGWNATKTSVNDWVRFIDAAGLSASGETNDELAAAQKLTAAADVNESMINAFVCVENQSSMFPPRSYTLPDGSTIARTEILGGINWGGGKLNVYGIICKVDGTLKLNPLYTLPYVEPQPQGLRGDANNSDDVTIADVSTIIDYLLGGDATAINLDNADCNLQDGVTIADVSALIDYLLSGNW